MLAEAFRLVGQSYNEMKLFDQSFENYKQAYDILSPLNDENCLYRAIFDMGRNLMLANKYSEAIEIFHDMFKKATTDNERAFVDQYISFCYLNLNNYDQAKQYAYQALDYACQSNEELLSIEANLLLGKIYLKLKDFQRAKDYFQYARNLKDQLGDLNQLNSFDEFLSAIENHQEKLSPIIKDFNPQWISSSMQNDENKSHSIEFESKNLSHWRILTPYHQLFRT
jgi:tetratricopeptide (TPR) repeat protein